MPKISKFSDSIKLLCIKGISEKDETGKVGEAFCLSFLISSVLLLIIIFFIVAPLLLIDMSSGKISAVFYVDKFEFKVKDKPMLNSIQFKSVSIFNSQEIDLLKIKKITYVSKILDGSSLTISPKYNIDNTYSTISIDTLKPPYGTISNLTIGKDSKIILDIDDNNELDIEVNSELNNNCETTEEDKDKLQLLVPDKFKLKSVKNNESFRDSYEKIIKIPDLNTSKKVFEIILSKYGFITIDFDKILSLSNLIYSSYGEYNIFDEKIYIDTPKIFSIEEDSNNNFYKKSSLLQNGEIKFLENPASKIYGKLEFNPTDIIDFGQGGIFEVFEIKFIYDKKGDSKIKVTIKGTPNNLKLNGDELDITLYDFLTKYRFLQIILDYIIWIIPIFLSIMGLMLVDKVIVLNENKVNKIKE